MVGRGRGRFGGRATAVGAACLVVIAFGLSGCTPHEEPTPSDTTTSVTEEPSTETVSPTPTPTPTETPTLTPEEMNVEAAKQTVIEYYALVNEVSADGMTTWREKLDRFWGTPELKERRGATYQRAVDSGQTVQGTVAVELFDVIEYVPDPTNSQHEQVRLTYCADTSAAKTFDGAGVEVPRSAPGRYLWSALMQRQSEDVWTFTEMIPDIEAPC